MDVEQGSIVLDPDVLAGKPIIRGTRLSVEFVIGLMADGWSEAGILANYPGIRHAEGAANLKLPALMKTTERSAQATACVASRSRLVSMRPSSRSGGNTA